MSQESDSFVDLIHTKLYLFTAELGLFFKKRIKCTYLKNKQKKIIITRKYLNDYFFNNCIKNDFFFIAYKRFIKLFPVLNIVYFDFRVDSYTVSTFYVLNCI